ncbi:MAG: putative lipid II flippase FtsW [Clostridia bacterium]|nr:putative lipid II flippase FtsW [Clostridia bacterium]
MAAQHKTAVRKAVDTESQDLVRVKSGIDRPFMIIVLLLVAIGTVMVFTSSYAYASSKYADSYFFAAKQIIWVAIGTGFMFFVAYFFNYLIIRWLQKPFFVVCMLAMALVLVFGKEVNEATRWFEIGPISIQPSEFAKLAIILYFSELISSGKNVGKSTIQQLIPYLAIGGYMAITLYLEPHLSCLVIVGLLMLLLMFFGDVPMKQVLIIGGVLIVALAVFIVISNHGMTRIRVWLNPEDYPQNGGWQPLQSLLAIGSGGFWGVGLGQSTQKHLYLPEPQNDYIFAILCEEMGFVFAVIVIGLFVALVWRGMYIAKHAPSTYASLVVIGIVSQVAIQAFLNIAVVTNTIPSTGISLPFFSYGGTSLITLMAEMGIVLNISKYSYTPKG